VDRGVAYVFVVLEVLDLFLTQKHLAVSGKVQVDLLLGDLGIQFVPHLKDLLLVIKGFEGVKNRNKVHEPALVDAHVEHGVLDAEVLFVGSHSI
jgi:hypothetical protein